MAQVTHPADPDSGKIFAFCEQMPEFNGGKVKLDEFISDNLHYPEKYMESLFPCNTTFR
jgi:hypothetical protein